MSNHTQKFSLQYWIALMQSRIRAIFLLTAPMVSVDNCFFFKNKKEYHKNQLEFIAPVCENAYECNVLISSTHAREVYVKNNENC